MKVALELLHVTKKDESWDGSQPSSPDGRRCITKMAVGEDSNGKPLSSWQRPNERKVAPKDKRK